MQISSHAIRLQPDKHLRLVRVCEPTFTAKSKAGRPTKGKLAVRRRPDSEVVAIQQRSIFQAAGYQPNK
jgi:hypothetical protein